MAHKLAEPYSGKNPVPQIATKITSLLNPERATEAKAQQLQDQSGQREQKQMEKRASKLAKGRVMRVTDPTTGEELDIRNADEEPDTRNMGENVLDTNFPPADAVEHQARVQEATYRSVLLTAVAYVTSTFLASVFHTARYHFVLWLMPPTVLAYVLVFRLRRIVREDLEDRVWHSERMRGLRAGSDADGDGKVSDEERIRESAEWANAVLRGLWPVLNPELFSSIADMVEDIMQASVPAFIHSVRIADLGLGRNAARITSIRSLPDAQTRANNKARAQSGESAELFAAEERAGDEQSRSDLNDSEREDLNGDHVNVEVSFAYRGLPSGRSAASKAGNVHLLVEFFLGLQGVYGCKVPVWVEVTGAVGTARARLQLIPDPPFVKTTMVSLMGLPRINISVIPLAKFLPNVMDFPFVSGFISSAIDTAVAEYVAPKSLTINLQRLISGDDIKKDTEVIGVLIVHIHRATDVKGMDADGGSDPYVTLTYSRLGKPLYSTRIIKGDRNPVFEETAVLMIDVNTIRLDEQLSFQLWDSDRMSVDDMLGVAEISIVELVRRRGNPVRCVSPLTGPNDKSRPGSVEYTVGYYGKMLPNSALKTDGIDPGIPSDLRDKPEFKEKRSTALNDLEAAVLITPPDPEYPSGILSMQVHEIRDLAVRKEGRERKSLATKGAGKKVGHGREGEKGQDDEGQPDEEAEGLPSSYCEISLNDELVYKTRVKPITSSPMFNAGTERFVRDWRTAHVTVSVKDSRMRENDAILGVVMLKLSELFATASQNTRFHSIEEGLGYGRIRISLLFRPVEAKLPPNLLGFDTGTLEIDDISAKLEHNTDNTFDLTNCEMKMRVTHSPKDEKMSRKAARRRNDGSVVWLHQPGSEAAEMRTLLPVRQRYGAALLLSFKNSTATSGFKKSEGRQAIAVLWLRDLADNTEDPLQIPLWQAKDGDFSRLKLNYVPPSGDLSFWDSDKENVRRIGTVELNLVFRPGISEQHKELMNGGGSKQKEAWDAFTRETAGGLRNEVGKMDLPDSAGSQMVKETQEMEGKTEGRSVSGNPSEIQRDGFEDQSPEAQENRERDTNTAVPSEEAESIDAVSASSSEDSAEGDSGFQGGGGLKHKVKAWRENERELHRDHRGIMQLKPARTAEWLKDKVEDGAHSVKERFSMRARKPDVETEV